MPSSSGFSPWPIQAVIGRLSSAITTSVRMMLSPTRTFALDRQACRKTRIARPSAPELDPWVEHGQEQVDDQVGGQHAEDQHRDDPLDGVEVERPDRRDE